MSFTTRSKVVNRGYRSQKLAKSNNAFAKARFNYLVKGVRANAAPTVATPLSDYTAADDAANVEVDLTTIFADDGGTGALTFDLSVSADASIADVTLSGTNNKTMTINYVAAGSTGATIRATDAAGLTVTDAFTITVTSSFSGRVLSNMGGSFTFDSAEGWYATPSGTALAGNYVKYDNDEAAMLSDIETALGVTGMNWSLGASTFYAIDQDAIEGGTIAPVMYVFAGSGTTVTQGNSRLSVTNDAADSVYYIPVLYKVPVSIGTGSPSWQMSVAYWWDDGMGTDGDEAADGGLYTMEYGVLYFGDGSNSITAFTATGQIDQVASSTTITGDLS